MVTMKLQQYNRDDQIAYYDCFPEGNTDGRFIIGIDLSKEEVIHSSLNADNAYSAHAMWRIINIYREKHSVPDKATAMWV